MKINLCFDEFSLTIDGYFQREGKRIYKYSVFQYLLIIRCWKCRTHILREIIASTDVWKPMCPECVRSVQYSYWTNDSKAPNSSSESWKDTCMCQNKVPNSEEIQKYFYKILLNTYFQISSQHEAHWWSLKYIFHYCCFWKPEYLNNQKRYNIHLFRKNEYCISSVQCLSLGVVRALFLFLAFCF